MPKRKWFDIKAEGEEATIYIYDIIGKKLWADDQVLSAKDFIDQLKALETVKTINVRLNSPGGEVFEGVAIHTALQNHPATIHVHIDGLAASIASVIAMAGDTVSMNASAMIMLHDPWTYTHGNAAELRSVADRLEKIGEAMVSSYVNKSGMDRAAVLAAMNAETWYTAADAVAAGLADDVTEAQKVAAHYDVSAMGYRHIPETLAVAPPTTVPAPDKKEEEGEKALIQAAETAAAQVQADIAHASRKRGLEILALEI